MVIRSGLEIGYLKSTLQQSDGFAISALFYCGFRSPSAKVNGFLFPACVRSLEEMISERRVVRRQVVTVPAFELLTCIPVQRYPSDRAVLCVQYLTKQSMIEHVMA